MAVGPGSSTDVNRERESTAQRGLVVLRLALGAIWTLNLLYIVDPANEFFPTFAATAASYGPTTLGGPAIAEFVATHASVFAALIAGVTAYLAASFLLGIQTRVACVVGAAFNAILLITQFAGIWTIPGATDVGPQPIYLAAYLALFIGSARGTRLDHARLAALVARLRPIALRFRRQWAARTQENRG